MIYLTTFILALFLTQIACGQQEACGDAISPGSSNPDEQYIIPPRIPIPLRHASYSKKYDNKDGLLSKTACPNIASHYKEFHNVPSFPRIGGSFDITPRSPNCGECWNITNHANLKHIYLTAIDSAKLNYFNISEEAFKLLNNGKLGEPLPISAQRVPPSFCIHH